MIETGMSYVLWKDTSECWAATKHYVFKILEQLLYVPCKVKRFMFSLWILFSHPSIPAAHGPFLPQAPGAAAQIRPRIEVLLSTKQEDGSSEPWSEMFRGATH